MEALFDILHCHLEDIYWAKKSGSIASTHWGPASMLTHPAHTFLLLPPLPFSSPPPHPLLSTDSPLLPPLPSPPHPFPPSSLSLLILSPLLSLRVLYFFPTTPSLFILSPLSPPPPLFILSPLSPPPPLLPFFPAGESTGSLRWRLHRRAMASVRLLEEQLHRDQDHAVQERSARIIQNGMQLFLVQVYKTLYCGGFSSRDPSHLEW